VRPGEAAGATALRAACVTRSPRCWSVCSATATSARQICFSTTRRSGPAVVLIPDGLSERPRGRSPARHAPSSPGGERSLQGRGRTPGADRIQAQRLRGAQLGERTGSPRLRGHRYRHVLLGRAPAASGGGPARLARPRGHDSEELLAYHLAAPSSRRVRPSAYSRPASPGPASCSPMTCGRGLPRDPPGGGPERLGCCGLSVGGFRSAHLAGLHRGSSVPWWSVGCAAMGHAEGEAHPASAS